MDGYQFFDVSVRERIRLSPSLMRFVLTGSGLERIRRPAPDLYLKIFIPTATAGPATLRRSKDWYRHYLECRPERRMPMRTYTVRALRPQQQAVVIDFALHGESGPASAWACRADRGDSLVLYAPVQASWGKGYTWRVPEGAGQILLLADECALPAAAAIMESLADEPLAVRLTALLEVPEQADRLTFSRAAETRLRWLVRHVGRRSLGYGEALSTATAAWLQRPLPVGSAWVEDDGSRAPLWDLADSGSASRYVWIAAETMLASQLRQLAIEAGVPRGSISCMGYWRRGRAQH
ncbi:siderophore-interacting protein [Frateuria aurantia]